VKKKLFPLFFLLLLQNLPALEITGRELVFYFSPEYNRTFNFCWDISAAASLTLNDRYTVMGGLSPGAAGNAFFLKGFIGGEFAIPVEIPFFVGLAYNYNGLPKYESHTHSILPLASLKWQRAGGSLGMNFRLTPFPGGPPVFEPVFTVSVYVNIINNDSMRLGLKIANFDDFVYGNFGSYFLNLNSNIRLNERISLINEIDIRQSGSIALAANFYGLVYRGGAMLSW